MSYTHNYRIECTWSGSTAVGYDAFDRHHEVKAEPLTAAVTISADPAFRGDPAYLNPEQLVVMAAASCQLLSFLSVAARARVDVVSYEDRAEGFMPDDDLPIRITRIELRPVITIKSPATTRRVARLVELAHRECYIANSLRTEIVVTPSIVGATDQRGGEAGP